MSLERLAVIATPLGGDVLTLRRATISERLGRLTEISVDLLSPDEEIRLDDVLGQSMTVSLVQPDGIRHFHGFACEFSLLGREGRYAVYRAAIRPWLWLLSRVADCRIFQNQSVPDILAAVFDQRGFTDYEFRTTGTYRQWEYVVQYRETDFNFCSRLMEQEGLYYFFEHEAGQHRLIIADDYSAHDSVGDIEYFPPSENVVRERECLEDWTVSKVIQPGVYSLNAFNFKTPQANLIANAAQSRAHDHASYEIYDFPGDYVEAGQSDPYVNSRLMELQSQHETARGRGYVRTLGAGSLFTLTEYPRQDQNREYLVTAATLSVEVPSLEAGIGGEAEYSCSVECIDARQQFRTPRRTPKPFVQGPQTATVVGPSGEEIHTDEYGRVKCQFHWDREGQRDENSSCWIRVAQIWAGKQWGWMSIPRIGQEVIVDFMEGDPDQPIITGRVYNADNMPPYDLPGNKTQSGIKSRSTKGGSPENFNEIRFEDRIGEEEMYIHAERDQNVVVENNQDIRVGFDDQEPGDRSVSVHNDERVSIGHDQSLSVANNRDKSVGVDQSESIGRNKTISVGASHSESVGANMTVNVGSNLTESVAVNYAETVGAAMELTIGAEFVETVGKDKTQAIGDRKSVSVGADSSEDVGGARTVTVGKDQQLSVGKKLLVDAGDEITFKTGSASLTMKKDGSISIKGKGITVNGKDINIKGSGNVVLKGSKVLAN